MKKYRAFGFLIKYDNGKEEYREESSFYIGGAVRKLYQHINKPFEVVKVFE